MLIHLQWPGPQILTQAVFMLEDGLSVGTDRKFFILDCNAEVEGKTFVYKGRNSHMGSPGERTMAMCYTRISVKGWVMFLSRYSDASQTREQREWENEQKQKRILIVKLNRKANS